MRSLARFRKYGSFLLFLLLAVSIWFVYRYQEIYRSDLKINILWKDIPQDIVVSQETNNISIVVEGIGYRLLVDKYVTKRIEVDLSQVLEIDNNSITISKESLLIELRKQLSRRYNLLSVDISQLDLSISQLSQKMVPLEFKPMIEFKNGLAPINDGRLSKDSVLLIGSLNRLDTINRLEIPSQKIIVSDSIFEKELSLSNLVSDVKVQPSSIRYILNAAFYTEARLEVPIEIDDLPDNVAVKVIPESVNVICSVRLNDFERLDQTFFKIKIPFENLEDSENIITPKLEVLGSFIKNSRIEPKQVKVLVVR